MINKILYSIIFWQPRTHHAAHPRMPTSEDEMLHNGTPQGTEDTAHKASDPPWGSIKQTRTKGNISIPGPYI